MKAYKTCVNEETMKIDIVEFDIDKKFDFSHDPVTNLCDSDGGQSLHGINKDAKLESVERLNKEIESGELSLLKCKDCERYFLLPRTEKEWFTSRGLITPKRCPKCRGKRKKPQRQLFFHA
jgi:hypothetical protein